MSNEIISAEEALNWCRELSYKPEYSFQFELVDLAPVTPAKDSLAIRMDMVVSVHDSQTDNPMLFSPIGGYLYGTGGERGFSTSMLYWQIFEIIANFENHERMEWLQYNGVPLINPHKTFQNAMPGVYL